MADDFVKKTDQLAREIGEDVGHLRGGQDDIDRRLADLRNRLAEERVRKYEPIPVKKAPVSAPDLPEPKSPGIGVDRITGRPLDGWAHVRQSIGIILMTRVGSRVMFRNFGSDVPKMIDANATPKVIMQFFVAIAEALDKWEPRFRLTHVTLTRAGPDGRFAFQLTGAYFPRGHLGDYSQAEDRSGIYPVARAA